MSCNYTDYEYENPWIYNEKIFNSSDIGIISGLFILLPIGPQGENILEESTFGHLGHLKEKKEK